MVKPYVNLNKHNIHDKLMNILNDSICKYTSIDGISGVS